MIKWKIIIRRIKACLCFPSSQAVWVITLALRRSLSVDGKVPVQATWVWLNWSTPCGEEIDFFEKADEFDGVGQCKDSVVDFLIQIFIEVDGRTLYEVCNAVFCYLTVGIGYVAERMWAESEKKMIQRAG